MVRTIRDNEQGMGSRSRGVCRSTPLLLLLAMPAAPAGVVKVERVSPPPLDLEITLPGASPIISQDGRFVAFQVRGRDTYVKDRQTGKTERVSATAAGALARGSSFSPAISADGRFVTFASDASNLAPGDTNQRTDVFVAERG